MQAREFVYGGASLGLTPERKEIDLKEVVSLYIYGGSKIDKTLGEILKERGLTVKDLENSPLNLGYQAKPDANFIAKCLNFFLEHKKESLLLSMVFYGIYDHYHENHMGNAIRKSLAFFYQPQNTSSTYKEPSSHNKLNCKK